MVGNEAWIARVKVWIERDFPNLSNTGYEITSPDTIDYNCIAWAAEDNERWWWPDSQNIDYWPAGVPREVTLNAFIQAYQTIGYQVCDRHNLEPGFQKIAIYADSAAKPTHAARQLPDGKWTSKLGQDEDIQHETLEGLTGESYGNVACIMRKDIDRPYATVILAISADGKIADKVRSPARFGSANDKAHLEQQVAANDAVLFGNGTLQAYGTTMRVISTELLKQRELAGKPPQPVQIVCSRSHQFDPNLRFFQQPVPRWLLTGQDAGTVNDCKFDRTIHAKTTDGEIDWIDAFQQLASLGIQRLAILGGGKLVASVLAAGLVDELWLTVCPLILGGVDAPTPVEGKGFLADFAPKLQLLAVKQVGQEVFLHYKVDRAN